ncbi:MAG: ATP-binding protein, partial [Bilophila sp.]
AQLSLYGVDSWMFIVLLNINSLFMLVVLFLVARNVVKLIMERRRKVFGAQIRTRLVVVFISLSLVPTVIMFLASNRVVVTSVDYWFTRQTESALRAALEVGQSFYAASADRLRARSQAVLQEQTQKRIAWGSPGIDSLLESKQKEYGLTLVGLVNPQGKEQNWHASKATTEVWKETRDRIDWNHVAQNTFGSLLWAKDDADYVIGVLAIDGGRSGYLVTAESIGQGLLTKLERISNGFEEYAQLKQLKKPLKVSFMLILGVLGMITIFGSVWFGFRLSKEFTAPILALAQGTTRIAQGDLDFRLDDKGTDELGLLVQSFNHMARDLQEGRTSLTHANTMLAEHNRYIETVLDNITTGVITLDADGFILTMNKAACSIFAADVQALKGHNPVQFLPASHAAVFASMLEILREHPEQNWQRQADFILGDRSLKLILHAVALSGPGGIRAYVVVVEDITELEKMQRMAAWREVARRIAHEIKNPLTPIKLSAQRLERKFGSLVSDPAFGQCTDLIVKQVERLQEMVQEFSAFAKLPEVQLMPGNIAPLMEELVTLFRNSHSSVDWELRLPETLPSISMDQAALHRALLNILTNAAEALEAQPPEESKKVRITAVHDSGRGSLRFILSDNGPGLNPEERERMFEPYFSRKKGGTGLGLAIVKSIIADHHGTVRAVGAQGGGTAIVVEIPVFRG